MLAETGLVHMNGRIYDPLLATFLSPDPFIQSPEDGQMYNRYSYVRNNPLSYDDPSGYIIPALVGLAVGIGLKVAGAHFIVAAIFATIASTIAAGALGYGPTFEGFLINAAISVASAWGAHQIGSYFNNSYEGGLKGFEAAMEAGNPDWGIELSRAMSHGVFQGGLSELAGGEFKSGFLAGMTGSVAGSLQMTGTSQSIMGLPGDGDSSGLALRTVSAATVGGTAAVIGGDKFANGAATSAFVHLFNAEGHIFSHNVSNEGFHHAAIAVELNETELAETNSILKEYGFKEIQGDRIVFSAQPQNKKPLSDEMKGFINFGEDTLGSGFEHSSLRIEQSISFKESMSKMQFVRNAIVGTRNFNTYSVDYSISVNIGNGGYNSNSYVSGMMNYAGGVFADKVLLNSGQYYQHRFPGLTNPVPRKYFANPK
jgi:RHS repeat-associated protein